MSIEDKEKLHIQRRVGTLAIDLGNSNTVVAFQGEKDISPVLLELPPITRLQGEIPSLIRFPTSEGEQLLIGNEVLNLQLGSEEEENLCSDFKRWIGAASTWKNSKITPEVAGEVLIHEIWKSIPSNLKIKRLVLTAPVDTYRRYRSWLQQTCLDLKVDEIALVDEPTAAAMGAGLAAGSKLLVLDIGGSTIDLSLVALEGGEGKAEPVAQLMRFNGEDLAGKSKQVLRTATVLGKAGLRLGGRDFDRWIINHLYPEEPLTEMLLNSAERIKCRLSNKTISDTEYLIEKSYQEDKNTETELRLNKMQFEELLIDRGLIGSLKTLLDQTLSQARANRCSLNELTGVVAVGGGTRIPLIKEWLTKQVSPIQVLTPPPIEAVAIGALSLTPGVKIKDVLQRGVSLRCWDEGAKQHFWHPLFLAGQPWPTEKGLEIVLSASKDFQTELELVIGEPEIEGAQEIIYKNGIPTIKEGKGKSKVIPWTEAHICINLDPPGELGKDCLRLNFSINQKSLLIMKGKDLRTEKDLTERTLGSIR